MDFFLFFFKTVLTFKCLMLEIQLKVGYRSTQPAHDVQPIVQGSSLFSVLGRGTYE